MKQHLIFDIELIGLETPVFLVCVKCVETGQTWSFWHHKRGHLDKLWELLCDERYTWVSFNGNHFDRPLLSAAICGADLQLLKRLATDLIHGGLKPWDAPHLYRFEMLEFDHIDLKEVAPGVMVSLKTYMGRLGCPVLQDLPFDHTEELEGSQLKILERYCQNDLAGTEALFRRLSGELALRVDLSAEHGIDLRSKSDAQMAEAILKKAAGIFKKTTFVPTFVAFKAPKFITTKNPVIRELIDHLEGYPFKIDRKSGSPELPNWLADRPIAIREGLYQFGLGGLHSQHDKALFVEASDERLISDFDAKSYYPSIILKCGLVPALGGKGDAFLSAYRDIYERRLAAAYQVETLSAELAATKNKQKALRLVTEIRHWKTIADRLKISLNGTFGKLGSVYSAFYAPDLMLAVTLTGQLNLLCLIEELTAIKGVKVLSANTDGIMVDHTPSNREKVLAVFDRNSRRTGFIYEETAYRRVAMKDVNNYIAITTSGKVKGKGLYAEAGLQKNPTMPACTVAAIAYLKDDVPIEETLRRISEPTAFMAVRSVTGGATQHPLTREVDDWVEVDPGQWARRGWDLNRRATVKRKSRPKPVIEGYGGIPLGRTVRWYMTTEPLQPLSYCSNGNQVPKTEGARACMILPTQLPKDLNWAWYVQETQAMLGAMGVPEFRLDSETLLQSVEE